MSSSPLNFCIDLVQTMKIVFKINQRNHQGNKVMSYVQHYVFVYWFVKLLRPTTRLVKHSPRPLLKRRE